MADYSDPTEDVQKLLKEIKTKISLNLLTKNFYDCLPNSPQKQEQLELLAKQLVELENQKQVLSDHLEYLKKEQLNLSTGSASLFQLDDSQGMFESTPVHWIPDLQTRTFVQSINTIERSSSSSSMSISSSSSAVQTPVSISQTFVPSVSTPLMSTSNAETSSGSEVKSESEAVSNEAKLWLQQVISMSELDFLEQLRLHVQSSTSTTDSTSRLVALRQEFLHDCVTYGVDAARAFCYVSVQWNVSLTPDQKEAIKIRSSTTQ
jgi:hypothetical protein